MRALKHTHRLAATAASRRPRALVLLVLLAVLVAPATAAAASVNVFPIPGSKVANPATQITFRGIPVSQLGTITVQGSKSGVHSGRVQGDSDGQGGSFLPSAPFAAGETVTVHTSLNVPGGQNGTYQFTVLTPPGAIPNGHIAPGPRTFGDVSYFHSRTDLFPASVKVLQNSHSVAPGDIFVAPQLGPDQDGPMILDSSGNLVWFHPLPKDVWATDFRTQTYQGQTVLTWWQGNVNGAGVGSGAGVIFDRNYKQIAVVHAANGVAADLHEFQITPQNTALVTAYEPVYWDATSVHGSKQQIVLDAIAQEIDIPTGLVLYQWDSLDHVPLTDTYAPLPAKGTRNPFDYFHVNSIQEDTDGNLIVSARNTWGVYKIDHQTGAVIWQLGGKHPTIHMGSGTSTAFQHHARVLPGGLMTVFDDGGGPPSVRPARGVLEQLNQTAGTATLVRSFGHSPPLHVNYEGSAQLLPNNDVFVGWGQQPYFSEFSPSGQQLFDARFVGINNSYRAYKLPWSAQPPTLPAAAAIVSGAGSTAVYASWNGATTVSSWRVLAGADAHSLSTVTTAAKRGFETAINTHIPAGDYVAVQALDGTGHTLATSSAVPVQSRVAVFGTTGFVSRGGVAGVLLACFGQRDCTGSLRLTIGSTVLGQRQRETIKAGDGGMVHISLTRAAQSQLAHARGGQLPVRVTVNDGGGEWTTTVVNLIGFSTSGKPPATSTRQSSTVRTFGSTAFASRSGMGGIFLACFNQSSCHGTLTVTAGRTVIARRTATLGADDGGIAHVSLTGAGRSLLAHARGNQLPIQSRFSAGRDATTANLNLVRFG